MKAGDVNPIFARIEQGDPSAGDQLLRLVYDELRELAAAKLARETPGQTLQPTALVHEAWLRLGGDEQPTWNGRGHFFGAAAEAMRRILIENARRKRAVRHGGEWVRTAAESAELAISPPEEDTEELLLLNEAIDALASRDPRKAELVKLRYFTGLTLEEAAGVMGISERTARRDWAYARGFLFAELERLRR